MSANGPGDASQPVAPAPVAELPPGPAPQTALGLREQALAPAARALAPARADTPARVLTPATSIRRGFPRITLAVIVSCSLLGIVAGLLDDGARQTIRALSTTTAIVAGMFMASWLEQRVYDRLLARGRLLRVALSVLLPLAALTILPLLAALVGAPTLLLGDGGTVMASLMLGSLWLAGAAAGSLIIVVLDVLISTLVRGFRTRVQLAVLGLLGVVVLYFVGVYAAGRRLADATAGQDAAAVLEQMNVHIGSGNVGDKLREWLASPHAGLVITLGVVGLGLLIALPAVLSACGKLADAVMERLNPLEVAFDRVGDGDLAVAVEEGGSRELVAIGRGFNRMTASLRQTLTDLAARNQELGEMNRAAVRFVPFQFLELLRKSSIREIERGDQIELEISVMFSDIRGFTTLAEKMGPQATFGFINRYVGQVESAIHREEGFINDIFGDGIMALFHRGADAALRAALGMTQAVAELNEALVAEGHPPITIGIGMHSGSLMLGTIGGAERLSCTVVGDPANTASRVEGMTKLYAARLLVSDATVARLADASTYRLRELDRVQAKGKHEPLVLYEVLDAEPTPVADAKEATQTRFAEALACYRGGAFGRARELFAACLADCPDDGGARLYQERCSRYLARPPEGTWDGVTRLEQK